MIRNLFLLNPMYLFIRYFRKIVIEATIPSVWFHLLMLADVVIVLGLGCLIYKKNNTNFYTTCNGGNMSILEVNHVSIRYMTGDFKDIGLKEYVVRKLKGNYHVNEFWADRDITFSLDKGEMMGIIGTNGAGKSTC